MVEAQPASPVAVRVPSAASTTSPLKRKVLYLFRSSLERGGLSTLRSRASPSLLSRPSSEREADLAWIRLWEALSNGLDVGAVGEDCAALLACQRWRRKALGERHGLWTRVAPNRREARAEWERLTAGIRAGVPASLRGSVWYACSGAALKRQEATVSYAELVRLGRELRNEATAIIEVDLPRTGVQEPQLGQLGNLLRAFAVRNPLIGYCQSMNFVSKTLLLYNDEEQTFWILCSLIEDVLPAGVYTPTMSGLRADLRVLDALIAEFLPALRSHLVRNNIDLAPITMSWFLCLFVNTLPAEESHRVLDCLLHEGSKVIFRAALSLLHLTEGELLKTGAVVDAYGILRAPFGDSKRDGRMTSARFFRTMYGLWLKGLSTDSVARLRAEQAQVVAEEDEAQAERREAYKKAKAEADAARGAEARVSTEAAVTADEPEEPAQLRAKAEALDEQLPVQPSGLGFSERLPDSPMKAAHWLAEVSGDIVSQVEDDCGTQQGRGPNGDATGLRMLGESDVLQTWEGVAMEGAHVVAVSGHGCSPLSCCQRSLYPEEIQTL